MFLFHQNISLQYEKFGKINNNINTNINVDGWISGKSIVDYYILITNR